MASKRKRVDYADIEGALRSDRNIKEKSYKQYMATIELDVRQMKQDNTNLKSFLSNTKKYDEYVLNKYNNPNTLKAHYNAMSGASHALGLEQAHKHYNTEMRKHADESNRIKKQGELKKKFTVAGMTSLPDWKIFKDRAERMNSYDMDHALAALYILRPPRRLEYRWLIYYDKSPFPQDPVDVRNNEDHEEEAFDPAGKAWNYLYPRDNKVLRMVLRKHKVDGKQGVYVKDLSPQVSAILTKYAQGSNVHSGEAFFRKPTGKNQRYKGDEFSGRVTDFLGRLAAGLGYPRLSETDLRSILITSTRNSNNMSYSAKEDLAADMGHGVTTAELVYNRPTAAATPSVQSTEFESAVSSQARNDDGGGGDVAESSRAAVTRRLDQLKSERKALEKRLEEVKARITELEFV